MSSITNVQESNWSNIELEPKRRERNQSQSSKDEDYDDDRICRSYFDISCCSKALFRGALVGVLLAAIPLAVIIILWTRSPKIYPTETVTTVTTVTTTTTTSVTTTSTTSKTTTTTTTTSTSATTTTTTTSTTSTSTTSKTTTTTSTTSTSATTTTTTTSTTSKTTTTTTTTSTSATTTTTTTPFNSCTGLRWNQTAITVAGESKNGLAASQLSKPICLEIDPQNVMYICDYDNYRIQKWSLNATNGTTVSKSLTTDRPVDLAISPNKTLYVLYQLSDYAARFTVDPNNGTTIAGVRGVANNLTTHLNNPTGIAIDDAYNIYITDTDNKRVVKWAPNATSGTIVIPSSAGIQFTDILLVPGTSDQFYLSSSSNDAVYLWQAGSSTPALTFSIVNHTNHFLSAPHGMKLDPYGNLYVVERGNDRVVKFCPPSTTGFVVVDGNQGPVNILSPTDLAFDSALNLYLLDQNAHQVFKYPRY